MSGGANLGRWASNVGRRPQMEVPWIRGEAPVVLRMKRERSGIKFPAGGPSLSKRRSAKIPAALRSDLRTERLKKSR